MAIFYNFSLSYILSFSPFIPVCINTASHMTLLTQKWGTEEETGFFSAELGCVPVCIACKGHSQNPDGSFPGEVEEQVMKGGL